MKRGRLYRLACRQTVKDCVSTPKTQVGEVQSIRSRLTRRGIENGHRSVENAQRPIDFNGEIHVPYEKSTRVCHSGHERALTWTHETYQVYR